MKAYIESGDHSLAVFLEHLAKFVVALLLRLSAGGVADVMDVASLLVPHVHVVLIEWRPETIRREEVGNAV